MELFDRNSSSWWDSDWCCLLILIFFSPNEESWCPMFFLGGFRTDRGPGDCQDKFADVKIIGSVSFHINLSNLDMEV